MGQRWATAVAVASAVAVGFAGCGGSGDDSGDATQQQTTQQLSSAEFVRQAGSICKTVGVEVARMRGPTTNTVEATRAWTDDRRAIQARGLEQLGAIAPPEAEQQAYEQLRATLADRVATMEAAQLKAATRDRTLGLEFRAFAQQERTLARLTTQLDVPDCNFQ